MPVPVVRREIRVKLSNGTRADGSGALRKISQQVTDQSQRIGTTTDTVSDFKQVEPDPALFTVPSDYSSPQAAQPQSANNLNRRNATPRAW